MIKKANLIMNLNKKEKEKKYRVHIITPFIIFLLISMTYAFPVYKNINNWGQMDWDQFTFWNAIARSTILKYHQFPLWNPYANGGNVLLAHPHSSFLSPFFIFVLCFGEIIGLKIQIIIHLLLGMLGMFLLSRYLKLGMLSSYLSSFIFMLSSIYPLHLTEGHASWLSMAFFPWVFLSCLKSFRDVKYVFCGIFFLSLILMSGSVDVFSILIFFLCVYSFFYSLQKKNMISWKTLLFIFVGTFLLCSIKLLPMFEFIKQHPRLIDCQDGFYFNRLWTILLNRGQAELYVKSRISPIFGLDEGWHEYGAYIGIFPLLLFIIGVIINFKKFWPLILTGIICLLVTLGTKSPINLWSILHSFPIYSSLSTPSRYILGFIFSVSLIAGLTLSRLEKPFKRSDLFRTAVISGIVLVVLLDLGLVNSRIFSNAFIIPPAKIKSNLKFRQRFKYINFYDNNLSRSSMYPIFLSNSGIIDGYEVMEVEKGNVLTISDQDYKGEAYLIGTKGTATIAYFSPNKVIVNVEAKEKGTLILNQNYYRGWRVVKSNDRIFSDCFDGLIATPITASDKMVTFYYLPTSFVVGLLISFLTFFYLLFKIARSLYPKPAR